MGQFFTKQSPPQQKTLKLLVADDYDGSVVPTDAFAKLVIEGGARVNTSSILSVKQRIFEVEGIPVERQRLFYETDCEGNDELANNVVVSCESHLVVLLQHPKLPNSQYRTASQSFAKPSSPQRKTLQLLVENYEMSTFAEEYISADAYTKLVIEEGVETISILAVKQRLLEVGGIPVEKQRLFYETDCRNHCDEKFECADADEIADDVVLLESRHLVLLDMTGHGSE
jgi:hypothetical protein